MNLLDYRTEYDLTQTELAEELKPICPGIDRVLISKIEAGICAPTKEVELYIERKTREKPCAHRNIERKIESRYIYRPQEKIAQIDDFDPLEELVLGALKTATKERPFTRAALKDLTGMKDSRARDLIGRLRDRGYRVVGSAGTKGYWIAKDESEYIAFRREYERKAMTYLSRLKAMDGYTEGQTSMYEEVH